MVTIHRGYSLLLAGSRHSRQVIPLNLTETAEGQSSSSQKTNETIKVFDTPDFESSEDELNLVCSDVITVVGGYQPPAMGRLSMALSPNLSKLVQEKFDEQFPLFQDLPDSFLKPFK